MEHNRVDSLEMIKQDYPGLTSQIFRIIPTYENQDTIAPTSFILKVSHTDKRSRVLSNHLFDNESRFYEHLSPIIRIKTPDYYSGVNNCATRNLSFLLLEDLSSAEVLEENCSCTDLSSTVQEVAKLHAQFLQYGSGKTNSWLHRNLYSVPGERSLHRLLDREIITDDFRTVLLQVIKKRDQIFDKLKHLPRTIIHGDFRSDNVVIREAGGKRSVCILDWQMVRFGHGLADISHFMSSTFSSETRRLYETDFLTEYHKVLKAFTGYSPKKSDYLRHYKLSTLLEIIRILHGARYLIGINASGSILQKGIYRLQLAMKRSLTAIKDHNSLALV
ncbi:MAG: ecdysteroid 22-kinase family protein [Bacteroidales bacterium]|nr:ecdysteroid 22-kinase family protein [Bacteroidales bacterium]